MKNLSIKTKIIVVIVGVVLVFGALVTWVVFVNTRNNLTDLAKKNLTEQSMSKEREVRQVLKFASDVVELVASNPEIVEVVESSDRSDKDVAHLTDHYLKTYNVGEAYSAIYVMDMEGVTIASTMESFVGKNYSFRDYYKKAREGESYADVAIGVTSGELGYYFSHPIVSVEGEIVGVAIVKMKPEVLERVLVRDKSDEMTMMLTDSEGVIIGSSDESRVMQRYDGETEYLASIKVENYEFFVIAEVELWSLLELARDTSMLIATFILVAAVLAGVSISLLVSKLLKPLGQLQEAVGKVAQGEKSDKIEVKSRDEIGQLATAFNQMIESIVEARDGVERKVKEQTVELEKQKEKADKARGMAEKVSQAMTGRELKMIELKREIQALRASKTTKGK